MTRAIVGVFLALAALYALWNVVSNVTHNIVYGRVDTDLVFHHRVHTYVVDNLGTCEIPEWVGPYTKGTLLTTGDCDVADWTTISTKTDPASIQAHQLCAAGQKMMCLIISNDRADLPRHKFVTQTLAKYTNDDIAWDCGRGCELVPAAYSFCLVDRKFGEQYTPEGFNTTEQKCHQVRSEVLSI